MSSLINNFKKKMLKIKEVPPSSLIKIAFGATIFLVGLTVLFVGLTENLGNTNEFNAPDSAPPDHFTLFTIESENLNKLDFKALTSQEVKIPEEQKSIAFILTDAKKKLKEFEGSNKGQNFLGVENGSPKYSFNLYAVAVVQLKQDDKAIETKGGALLYKGYESFEDLNAGVNKCNFAITGDSIQKLENGTEIETNVGKIKLKQGD